MKKMRSLLLVVSCVPLLFAFSLFASDKSATPSVSPLHSKSQRENFTLKDDMAFISVWGNRPDAKELQGFQRAVLFNARGEVVKRLDLGRDSIYSLDRMIQENRTKGPLFIRMYRR